MLSLAALLALVVAAALVESIAVVRRVHRPARRWRDVLESRLVYGVPWGSLIVIAFVVCVYLFVQDGIADVSDPVTVPYRSWSYFYPLGMATAAFSHAGLGHLLGNLAGTVVVAPLVEFAWGHYPDDRDPERPDSWRTNPRVRAFALFPLAVIAVGLVTSLFSLGPVIGFSGVVFALAGFAIVHYPIVTIVGTLGVQSVILRLYYALQEPISVYTAQPSPPSAPSWAGIAIQGHALGLFVGFVLGIALLERRGTRPNPLRLWLAVLLFGFSKRLWAIYWFGGENRYILFQGPGVAVVSILALVVTLSMTAAERPLVPARLETLFGDSERANPRANGGIRPSIDRSFELAGGSADKDVSARLERVREIAAGTRTRATGAADSSTLSALTRKGAAFLAVVAVLAILAGVAIPAGFLVVEDASASSDAAVQIEDYTVEYVEGVPNGLVSGIGIEALESDEGLESSGVIVASEQRNIWLEAVSAQRLSVTGEETVTVGGPGWREAVHVEREGWTAVGNETAYRVWIRADGEHRLAHVSDPVDPDVRVDGRTVRIVPAEAGFFLEVADDDGVSRVEIPAANETVAANGLRFERDGDVVVAHSSGTRVPVASEETYRSG